MRRRTFILSMLLSCLAATAALAFENHFPEGFTYMSSPSLPEGWYVTRPVQFPLVRGQTVCAVYHQPIWAAGRRYLPNGSYICKHVFGLPGDRIDVAQHMVHICEAGTDQCFAAGRILTHDMSGRPVFAVPLPKRIPAGYVYLGSTRVTASFDSRYLGVFPEDDVKLAIRKI